jgi:hypothetical protein
VLKEIEGFQSYQLANRRMQDAAACYRARQVIAREAFSEIEVRVLKTQRVYSPLRIYHSIVAVEVEVDHHEWC